MQALARTCHKADPDLFLEKIVRYVNQRYNHMSREMQDQLADSAEEFFLLIPNRSWRREFRGSNSSFTFLVKLVGVVPQI